MPFTKLASITRTMVRQKVTPIRAFSALVVACAFHPAWAAFPESDLRSYYRDFPNPTGPLIGPTSQRPAAELRPRVDITGGGPGLVAYVFDSNPIRYVPVSAPYSPFDLAAFGTFRGNTNVGPYRDGVCNGFLEFTSVPVAGSSTTLPMNYWHIAVPGTDGSRPPTVYVVRTETCDVSLPTPAEVRRTNDELTFGAPIRRTAIDGSQYDASPMKLTRNGLPWYTHFFGYHLGLVANDSNWDNANLSKAGDLVGFFLFPNPANNFELTALPPPWVEDDVVEYVNKQDFPKQPGGQYFYAVRAEDKTLLDSVANWRRTGKAFKSGGYVSVCRFYGGKNGGPNTHFYSADDKECAALKAIPQLSYEGQTFAVNMPMPGANADGTKPCPIDSKPLYRLYNNASAPGKDYVSNHRYVTERTDVVAAVAQGWVDEGQVMCVPL